ncbi:MAG: hypothetical protein RLZZ617_698, partial [Bacteroidota bacterium]
IAGIACQEIQVKFVVVMEIVWHNVLE